MKPINTFCGFFERPAVYTSTNGVRYNLMSSFSDHLEKVRDHLFEQIKDLEKNKPWKYSQEGNPTVIIFIDTQAHIFGVKPIDAKEGIFWYLDTKDAKTALEERLVDIQEGLDNQ